MRTIRLLLRWSWRDLRAHWTKVAAIAVVIAIGTGGYAGLTSTTEWRKISYDASYGQLAMYDLRVDLAPGSFVDQGVLTALADGDAVAVAEERLIVPTQVDASTEGETVLVRGAITGADFSANGPHVNSYHAMTGRLLTEDDAGAPALMIERNFARFYSLADSGFVALGGGRRAEFVGQATTPEYFSVAPEGEMFMSEATFAGLFTTIETAQDLAGLPGKVNNLVVTLAPGADRDEAVAQLEDALTTLPVGATVFTRDDNLSYTALTTDIEQDQAIFNALAALLIGGAVGAAFNLIHRLAEQQRREIGIGMALGVHPRILAVRPLLVSAQIATLGVIFGVGVGMLIGNSMATVFTEFIPLPIWETPFPTAVFVRVAAIGLVVPFLASAIPVWRAVRVRPIEAIKPAHLTGKGPKRRRRHTPRNIFAAMPLRNLRRSPRRTALTILGIAASLTVLTGFLGIMDSVFGAVDRAETEAVGTSPERITVALDTFHPMMSPEVEAVGAAASVETVEAALRLAGSVAGPSGEFELFIEMADLTNGMWSPSVTDGALSVKPGLILAEKAAIDLGVDVGDTVLLHHPVRQGLAAYTFVDTEIEVLGTHPAPLRSVAYMHLDHVAMFNLEGIANALNVLPAAGFTLTEVQEELFALDSVASVQSVTTATQAVRDAFEQTLAIIQVMVVAILFLALLIAFNTAAINLEARARDHATMFAFGVKVRTALRMAAVESFTIGTMATVLGLIGGLAMVWWMTQRLLAETLPDFALPVVLKPTTVIIVAVMGVLAVSLAPLLTVRRMRRMDLPGTLRLME
ncbi:MAG: ABC transporter permease [bacterium]|nr:ABC transporter permease [bacterium]